jgi:O-6-methylguanine DNA methyltransferase
MGDGFVSDLCRRFEVHLAGSPVAYDDVPLDVPGLSPFQEALLDAARTIGWGEIVTYGDLAARAGRPRAARAAGTFCAQSRLSLVVPCHRVVASDGGLGGFGWGLDRKRVLLDNEHEHAAD